MPLDVNIHLDLHTIERMSTINNKVLVEIFDDRNKTKSGINIPITKDNPYIPNHGVVVKIPKTVSDFKVRDEVAFTEYKGTRVFVDDNQRQFILLDASYILAIIKKD